MSVTDDTTGDDADTTSTPATVTADVGHGWPDGKEVPEEIEDFELWDCPNNDTINYEREHFPADGIEYPRVVEKVGITVAGDGWDVTRSVVVKESGTRRNIRTGEPFDTVVQDVQYHGCVGTGFDTFEAALNFAEHHIRGLSRMGLPQEVNRHANPIHDAFQDIRIEEARDDNEEPAESEAEV